MPASLMRRSSPRMSRVNAAMWSELAKPSGPLGRGIIDLTPARQPVPAPLRKPEAVALAAKRNRAKNAI